MHFFRRSLTVNNCWLNINSSAEVKKETKKRTRNSLSLTRYEKLEAKCRPTNETEKEKRNFLSAARETKTFFCNFVFWMDGARNEGGDPNQFSTTYLVLTVFCRPF